MIPRICFYVVIKLRGFTQLNILASYLSLENNFQLSMVLLKENCIPPVTVYLLTVETQQELLQLQLLESYCLPILTYCTVAVKLSIVQTAKLKCLMLVGIVYSAKFLVFINGNQSVVL